MNERKSTRYVLQMNNRPGELMKLMRILAVEGVDLRAIKVASVGATASIEFSAVTAPDFGKLLRESGIAARIAS